MNGIDFEPAWTAAGATAFAYGLILLAMVTVLFLLPYALFAVF